MQPDEKKIYTIDMNKVERGVITGRFPAKEARPFLHYLWAIFNILIVLAAVALIIDLSLMIHRCG
jgi:hypothetical protein